MNSLRINELNKDFHFLCVTVNASEVEVLKLKHAQYDTDGDGVLNIKEAQKLLSPTDS